MTVPAIRVRPAPRWVSAPAPDPAGVRQLSETLGVPPTAGALLWVRGYRDADAARLFLRPRLERLHSPLLMRGMAEAVERLSRAVREREVVLVHGDYDVDGMCATTLLVRTLRHLGGIVVPFIPNRLRDGYDLTDAGVKAAVEHGAKVLITCDCGTSAHAAVADLRRRGIDVILSDHHLPGQDAPACTAVLNPRIPGCDYPDKDLCAAGVAFKLALALLEREGASTNVALNMLDLVALATIADVAPLRGENRILVRYGLRLLADSRNLGLRALIASAGLEGKELTAGRVAFILAPRLNAVGRLGSALRGVELLLSESPPAANRIARELEELNRARQTMDRDTLLEARRRVEALDLDRTWGIVLGGEGWHPGVIGIVASRLVEEFCRPTVLIATEKGIGKGSGRSIPAFDLHAGLASCADVMLRYGGHRAAAGLTMEAARIPELAERFNAVAHERLQPEDLVPELRVDLELALPDAGEALEACLRHFEPFGVGNPAPVFATRGVRVTGAPRLIGQSGMRLRLGDGGTEIEGIWWGASERVGEFPLSAELDIAYRLERDTYQDRSRLIARLADARR